MSKFDNYDPGKDISKTAYSWNIVYPSYMSKVSTMVYLLEDFEKNYCYVEATYVISGTVN
jgi:hypothetical protein